MKRFFSALVEPRGVEETFSFLFVTPQKPFVYAVFRFISFRFFSLQITFFLLFRGFFVDFIPELRGTYGLCRVCQPHVPLSIPISTSHETARPQ
jgi:hypothetical protein